MSSLFSDFPYLWLSLAMALAACAAIAASRRHRLSLVIAGSLGMLFGFFSFEFIPWYWEPRVVWHLIASPEDLIFSFATGALTWWLASRLISSRLRLETRPGQCILRGLKYSVPGVAIAYSLGLTIMNHMPLQTTLIGVSIMGVIFLWLKRDFWHVALFSATVFTMAYMLLLRAAFVVWPEFHLAWKPEIQPRFEIFGLPPFEVFWAFGYGFVFPLFILLVLDARLESESDVLSQESVVRR